jgi:hypothetical protein
LKGRFNILDPLMIHFDVNTTAWFRAWIHHGIWCKKDGHGHMILYNYTWTNLKIRFVFHDISWIWCDLLGQIDAIHNGPWKFIGYHSCGIIFQESCLRPSDSTIQVLRWWTTLARWAGLAASAPCWKRMTAM